MDLKTTYMGLDLKHPLVASAGPISKSLDGIKRLEDAGASAVVLFSLFEEQIRQENESFELPDGSGHRELRGIAELFSRSGRLQGWGRKGI